MSELKDCPMCGGKPEAHQNSRKTYHYIFCDKCILQIGPHESPAAAAEAWNHRAPVSTPQQSAQRASVDTPTDEQISAIYRSTFPRGPYLITPDAHKFARAVLAWGGAGSGATNRLKSDEVKNG